MQRESTSLWNVSFARAKPIASPVLLLREQAEYLYEQTGGIVGASVASHPLGSSGAMLHTFRLVVPALDNYKYTLFHISGGPTPYPVTIGWGDKEITAADRGEFISGLQQVFNSPTTTEIITNLMQVAEDTEGTETSDG